MENLFYNLPSHAVRLKGPLGKALLLTQENRLKKVNYSHLVDPFRFRRERDGLWRCEFWGKIVRSAIHVYRASGDEELLSKIRETVADLISTQTADGCISSYPIEKQTSGWDLWGRKYVLLALIRYYHEIEQDENVGKACCRMLDHLMTQIPMTDKKITEYGEHLGLAASSILGAVVGVYKLSGEPEYLEYAKWIAESGFSRKHNVVKAILAGLPPAEIGNGKAYELTSCIQGLADLCRIVPNERWQNAVVEYWKLVRQNEIFITGIGGLKDLGGEYWFYGAMRQTLDEPNVKLGETCITTEWIRFSDNLLRFTADPAIAEAMEQTFYNGLLGAMKPDGSGWTHGNPSPLAGSSFKFAANDQIAGFGEDCCLAQGPEGIGMVPLSAVMKTDEGVVINFYEDLEADFLTPRHHPGTLNVTGGYPFHGNVRIRLNISVREEWTFLLRIPSWWNETCRVSVNGEVYDPAPGKYLSLKREWKDGDVIELIFDLIPRPVESPDLSRVSLLSGPIVLARDSRFTTDGSVDIPILPDISFRRLPEQDAFHTVWELSDGSYVCDYASAGNLFSCDNRLCVWFRRT